jgi:hypothetical protein
MKPDKSLILVLVFFLLLSILASWQSMLEGGHFVYRDAATITNLQSFRDNFLSLYKNHNMIDFDFYKRIPESWIYLLTDMETYDRIKFTLIPFAVLTLAFFVGERILGESGVRGTAGRLIAVAFALVYLFNPVTLQVFLKYYPMINMAVFPLFFYLSYDSFSKLSLKSALLAGLLAGFMFLMVVHALLYMAIAVPLAALVSLRGRDPLRLIMPIIIFSLAFIFSTAFVISPYLVVTAVKSNFGFHPLSSSMLDVFSYPASLPAPMLMDYEAFWWPWVDYAYPFGQAFFLITCVFASVLLIFGLSDKNPWSLMASLGLVAVFFLSKGSGSPFGAVYEFLNFHLPLIGWLMRVPNKFLHILPFFISLIFLRFCAVAHQRKILAMKAFAILSVPLLIFLSWPYMTGDVGGNLVKRDYSVIKQDLEGMNAILGGNSSVVAYGIHKSGSKDLYGNVFSMRTFLYRELKAYDQNSNYSGMAGFGSLGVEYMVVGGKDNIKDVSRSFSSVFDGDVYSIFRIANSSSDVGAPSSVYACYGSYETVRSLMREPPENQSLDMVLFPLAFLDYPREAVDAADAIVLDSVPLVSPAVDSGSAFAFYYAADAPSTRKGWARLSPDSADNPRDSPFRTWDHHFEKAFAATYATASRTGGMNYERVIGPDELALNPVDTISLVNGSYVGLRPGKEIYSSVRSFLDIESGSDYRIRFFLRKDVYDDVNAKLFIQDSSGEIIKTISLLSNGENVSKEFTVPPEAVRVSILFTALAGENRTVNYSIDDFEIHRIYSGLAGPRISQSFTVQNGSDYDIYLRMYKGPYAGKVRIYLDGAELYSLETRADISHFYWEKVYSGSLSQGAHTISIEQLSGYNALNIGYVRPAGAQLPDWENKTILFRLTGLGDFGNNNYKIVNDSASSTFYLANSSEPLLASFDVFSEGEYRITSSIRGAHELLVDAGEANGSLYLAEGTHTIEVVPLNGSVAVDHVTLTRPGAAPNAVSGFSYEKTGPSSYTIAANSTGPFFISLNRGFSPLWLAESNGNQYRPFPSYFSLNGFLINGSGPTTITVEFEPQKFSNIWALIGAIGILALAMFVWRSGK